MRQGLPSCLVMRRGDMYMKASQTSYIAAIAQVLHARHLAIATRGNQEGPARANAGTTPLWTVLPRQATDNVFKQHMRECVEESEGAAWDKYWRGDLGKKRQRRGRREPNNEGTLHDGMLHQF